jgi:hypothetical protein
MAVLLGAILSVTMKRGIFDGLVSYFPSLIDFEWVGIAGPPGLARRFVQIEKEARILDIVYATGGIIDEHSQGKQEPEPPKA